MDIKFNAWDKQEKKMILWYDLTADLELIPEVLLNDQRYIPLLFAGIEDINKEELFTGDLIQTDVQGTNYIFRIYFTKGGFAIKAPHWSKDHRDLIPGDELILTPLTDAQTVAFINQGCRKVGNIYEGLKIDL